MKTIMVVMGTRPEVIKQAPLVLALQRYPDEFRCLVMLTAQHREMMDQMIETFGLQADYDLDIMQAGQSLGDVTVRVISKIEPVLQKEKPDFVVVQGDTTTSFAAGLAAFYQQIPVAHVEAGLRTYKMYYPYPEEINRQLLSRITTLHFPPTDAAKQNLLDEGVPQDQVFVTGNTVIDALHHITRKEHMTIASTVDGRRKILITMHRRENFGQPMADVCDAINQILSEYDDVYVVFPVHLNPNVRKIVNEKLVGNDRIELKEPLDYVDFVREMASAYLLLSDSGGVQEEAPSLDKPVLVLRNETERMEGVDAGVTRLVGTDKDAILENLRDLLDNEATYQDMGQRDNPYGDGNSSERIIQLFRDA